MNKFVRTKSHTGSKFSKTLWGFYARKHVMDCSCAPVLGFGAPVLVFSAASDSAATNRQIPDRIFGQFFYQFEEGERRHLCMDLDAVFAVCWRYGCALQRTKRR